MTTRANDEFRETLRREIMRDLPTNARVMHTRNIASAVDCDALNKCRLSMYGQMRRLDAKLVYNNEIDEEVQRAWRKMGNYTPEMGIGMEDSIEKLYFDKYGEGFNGSPVVDRPNGSYRCPCGVKFGMIAALLPEECPACHRLTPRGMLIRDGYLHRRPWTDTRRWTPRCRRRSAPRCRGASARCWAWPRCPGTWRSRSPG